MSCAIIGYLEEDLEQYEVKSNSNFYPNLISQLEYPIYPYFDEVRDVYGRALQYGWTLFLQTIPILEKITPEKQNESMATYYSKKEDHLLGERADFTKKASLKHYD